MFFFFISSKYNFLWQNFDSYPIESGMGDPGSGGTRSGEVCSGRTRKRILDPLEAHEDDNTTRRLGVFTEWQETMKSIGVPNKKGNAYVFFFLVFVKKLIVDDL